jgi:hypothetical protein
MHMIITTATECEPNSWGTIVAIAIGGLLVLAGMAVYSFFS